MNIPTLIIAALVVTAFVLAVRYTLRHGSCSECSGSCGSCGSGKSCSTKERGQKSGKASRAAVQSVGVGDAARDQRLAALWEETRR